MNKNDKKDFSLWKKFIKAIKKLITLLQKYNQDFSERYPNILPLIQLSIVYFLAILSLFYSLISILGQIPESFLFFVPQSLQNFLQLPIMKIILAPEKTYVVYLLVIEFIIFRSVFKFSLLFKYNLLLIFLLEMFQNLFISYWDLFFTRSFDTNDISTTDYTFSVFFISLIYLIFFYAYIYAYICALRGKFVTYPYMDWLTDSISFWLQIKTPNMGNYGGKNNEKRKN